MKLYSEDKNNECELSGSCSRNGKKNYISIHTHVKI